MALVAAEQNLVESLGAQLLQGTDAGWTITTKQGDGSIALCCGEVHDGIFVYESFIDRSFGDRSFGSDGNHLGLSARPWRTQSRLKWDGA
jgi:hypothetical protein